LLVDDDPEIVESMKAVLESRGYAILVARDGNQGLAMAEQEAPDLVVLDMMMPKRSGFLVLEKLRRGNPNPVRVIMITANEGSRHKAYAEMLGVDDYIRKPFAACSPEGVVAAAWRNRGVSRRKPGRVGWQGGLLSTLTATPARSYIRPACDQSLSIGIRTCPCPPRHPPPAVHATTSGSGCARPSTSPTSWGRTSRSGAPVAASWASAPGTTTRGRASR
jgi:CheY-like chemotaxis protein